MTYQFAWLAWLYQNRWTFSELHRVCMSKYHPKAGGFGKKKPAQNGTPKLARNGEREGNLKVLSVSEWWSLSPNEKIVGSVQMMMRFPFQKCLPKFAGGGGRHSELAVQQTNRFLGFIAGLWIMLCLFYGFDQKKELRVGGNFFEFVTKWEWKEPTTVVIASEVSNGFETQFCL